MQKIYFVAFFLGFHFMASAQFVTKLDLKENVPGICDKNEVYALFSAFKGQDQARCPVTKDAILQRLHSEIALPQDPKYTDKGSVGLLINCKGEVVQCKMDNKTKSAELDKQIEAVFRSLGVWTAGKFNGREVDTSELYSFKIKEGKFKF